MSGEIRIGTRGSRLALVQARMVADALMSAGETVELVVLSTVGDRRPPDTAWGEGAFVSAIEEALRDRAIDVAVHSAKDMPTDEPRDLRTAAYLPRADPRDALVLARSASRLRLASLPAGTRVGTDSPRRTAFLLARRPDLRVRPLHGNVDTRLDRLDAGEVDALVLACAGLDRLGRGDRITERLDPTTLPPAPGQGALAVQVRIADADLAATVAGLDHPATRLAVETEREVLRASGGGCRAPLGALASLDGDSIRILAGFAAIDGSAGAFETRRAPVGRAVETARELARSLLRSAGRSGRGPGDGSPGRRVLVTRAADAEDSLSDALGDHGLAPVSVPAIEVALESGGSDLDSAMRVLHAYRWIVLTSANGARAVLAAAERVFTALDAPAWAVVGPGTRAVLEREGIGIDFEPSVIDAEHLAAAIPIQAGDPVVVVRGDLAGDGVAQALRARGADVDDVVAYRTREAPSSSRVLLRAALASACPEAAVFTSGSTVRGLAQLADVEALDVRSIPAVCIGESTAREAKRLGFRVSAVSDRPDITALAATTAAALGL